MEIKSKHGKEIELITLIARKEKLSHPDLCKKLKEDLDKTFKASGYELSTGLKDMLIASHDCLPRIIPFYVLLSNEHTSTILTDSYTILKVHPFATDTPLLLDTFSDLKLGLTSDHMDALKIKYLQITKGKPLTINTKTLLEDI